jgi:hypothetical protein
MALWVFPETTTTATLASVSERLEHGFCITQTLRLAKVMPRWNNLKTGMRFSFSAHVYDIHWLMNTVANCGGCIGNSGFPEPERTNSNSRSRHSYRPLVLPRHDGGEGVVSIAVSIYTVGFNIPKFCILPTTCLYVKYVSQNQQRIFSHSSFSDWFS